MDASDLIDKVEKYLRDFITYLLAFFDSKARHKSGEVNQVVMFGIISAGIGSYLWNRYVERESGQVADAAGQVVDKLLEWCVAGVFIFLALRAARFQTEIVKAVTAAIRTLAAAQIVAVGAVFVILQLAPFSLEFGHDMTNGEVVGIAYLIHVVLVALYLPGEILRIDCTDHAAAPRLSACRRKRVVAAASVAFVLAMFVMSHFALPGACDPDLARLNTSTDPAVQRQQQADLNSQTCKRFMEMRRSHRLEAAQGRK